MTPSPAIRPDRVTVWFVADHQVGVDVRWGGMFGDRRANAAHERLRVAGHPVSITEDELGWCLRVAPLDPDVVGDVVGRLVTAL